MKHLLLLLSVVLWGQCVMSQAFQIGHISTTFQDSVRNRAVPAEIYYPATTGGEEVNVAPGTFPVVVFGHGFVMATEAYDNFNEAFVPQGFIFVYPTTEDGFSPSHESFGQDMAFLVDALQEANTQMSSIFNGAISNKSALMGHSMGGGASVLAANLNASVTALVNFAAAETNPSAISAASSVVIPTLMFAGGDDCVAPPSDHQVPIYSALGTSCKTLVTILGGGHCYFANYNFNCTFGESTCLPIVPISSADQQSVVNDLLLNWLNYWLYDETQAIVVFNDSLENSPRITYQNSCSVVNVPEPEAVEVLLFPNPASNFIHFGGSWQGMLQFELRNHLGQLTQHGEIHSTDRRLDVQGLAKGMYFIKIHYDTYLITSKLIVN